MEYKLTDLRDCLRTIVYAKQTHTEKHRIKAGYSLGVVEALIKLGHKTMKDVPIDDLIPAISKNKVLVDL